LVRTQVNTGDNVGYKSRIKRETRIVIYCSLSTKRRMRAFKELHGFSSYEEMINALIDYFEGKVIRSI